MRLRGIEYGRVFNSSGARNFFGEEDAWFFHRVINAATKPARRLGIRAGLNYDGATFVAKTTTFNPREGNLPLFDGTTKPREFLPRCIIVKPRHGAVLNKVGLSGPGFARLLEHGHWQKRKRSFVVSFMPVEKTESARLLEVHLFADDLKARLGEFNSPFALQLNVSCPNTEHEQDSLICEVTRWLDVLASTLPSTPIILKTSPELETEVGVKIAGHEAVDAIAPNNTVRWGKFPYRIDWLGMFGSTRSPLAYLGGRDTGGGGLSGDPIRQLALEWIVRARRLGFRKTIVGGGGILRVEHVKMFKDAGADAIEVGCVSILSAVTGRWGRVPVIIDEGNKVFA